MPEPLSPEEIVQKLEELCPDNLFESKDWRSSDLIGKVEWLLARHESLKEEIDMWVDQLSHCSWSDPSSTD